MLLESHTHTRIQKHTCTHTIRSHSKMHNHVQTQLMYTQILTRISSAPECFPFYPWCVIVHSECIYCVSAHPVTMEETDWRQHVTSQGHNGEQISAIQIPYSCDTNGLFWHDKLRWAEFTKVMLSCGLHYNTVSRDVEKNHWSSVLISACCHCYIWSILDFDKHSLLVHI